MTRSTQILTLVALLPLLWLAGCKRRPQPVAVPVPPPPIAEEAPAEQAVAEILITEPTELAPQPEPEPAPAPPARRPRATASAPPPVVVEPEPEPASPPMLSAGLPDADAEQHRRRTEQLLAIAEANLRGITRPLSRHEEGVAQQIRNFVQQARQATAAADLVRARTLAVKAHLLSNELIKR